MDFIVLLAVGIVIAIPVIAIVALFKSGYAVRRMEEYADQMRGLERDAANLRRELDHVVDRLSKFESVRTAPRPVEAHTAQAQTATAKPVPAPVPDRAAAPLLVATTLPFHSTATPNAEKSKTIPVSEPIASVPSRPPTPVVAAFEAPVPTRQAAAANPAPLPQVAPTPRPPAAPVMPSFAAYESAPADEGLFERLKSKLPLEQFLGMNLFAKIGIVLLVLGFALLGRMALVSMGPAARAALIFAVAGAMLGGGVWFEVREKYRLVGRACIGGGWALLFFTTYAINHVAPMTVLHSNTADCILMLIVAAAMVIHTLRYRSQLVTGLAFLLAFSTIALSQDSVYALAAGVVLALGIVAIALRMSWFELEFFGILSSYANHLYWLYRLYPDGMAGHAFPQFWPSAIILVLYWAIFRASYIARTIKSTHQESISTLAAVANTLLLLVSMKFQSIHPELAFYALLGLGALEFLCGQLPITRRRHAAFTLLTVTGTLLVFAAIPFKFTGNDIALFWMIGAEALLVAGIVQRESIFRYLGLISGCVTGLLIVFEARDIVAFRTTSEAVLIKDGILLVFASALFYLNALLLRSRWREIFAEFEAGLAASQGYLGCITAFLGAWALFPADWTAIAWAALLLGAAFGARRLQSKHLLAQSWLLALAAAIRAAVFNCHIDVTYPHHITLRLLTLPPLAIIYYVTAWLLAGIEDLPISLQSVSLWVGSASLAMVAWLEFPQPWVAPAWAAMTIALCFAARRLKQHDFSFQEHLLSAAVAAQLFLVNLAAHNPLERYLPCIGCAAILYAISRICTQPGASYRRPAAWLHTWTATALLSALAWHESPQPWLTVIWILFALAVAVIDRIRNVEELPWQAHSLAALAVAQAVTLNFFLTDTWHGIHLRLITISVLVVGLYNLAHWVRLPAVFQRSGVRHVYSWVGTALAAWLLWSELQLTSVAVGLAILGLALFELGVWRKQRQLRLQSYALLTASFVQILFVNLSSSTLRGEWLNPRVYTVASVACIYFYLWSRLRSKGMKPEIGHAAIRNLIAYFGTGSIVGLLYFQAAPEWIIVAWAAVVLALMTATLALGEEVLLEQAVLLTFSIVLRGLAFNLYGEGAIADGGWRGTFAAPALTVAALLAALPLAFRVRNRYVAKPPASIISRSLGASHPEQVLFFSSLILIVLTIAAQMNPGMVTLAWGIVGVATIVLGLLVTERSYRLTGLFLLLLCVGKIVFRDAWQLDERDRYITFIVLGAALTLVSALYSKYRDHMSRLL
jgi:uncharacterized membrane protein